MISRILDVFHTPSNKPETINAPNDIASSYFTLYRDGFSVGGTSVRLSNIPVNIKKDTVYSYSLLLSLAGMINQATAWTCSPPYSGRTTHFFDYSAKTDYKYHSMDQNFHYLHNEIKEGLCGANPSISNGEISSNFIGIGHWTGDHTIFNERAGLYRGAGDLTNGTLEECLKKLLTTFNDEYQKLRDAEAEVIEHDKTSAIVWAIIGGCLITSIYNHIYHYVKNKHNDKTVNLQAGQGEKNESHKATMDIETDSRLSHSF